MADFADIQTKFDADPALRRKLLADPVGVLAQHGITLTPQQAFRLQQDVHDFMASQSGVTPDIEIGVGVGIKPPSVHVHISF